MIYNVLDLICLVSTLLVLLLGLLLRGVSTLRGRHHSGWAEANSYRQMFHRGCVEVSRSKKNKHNHWAGGLDLEDQLAHENLAHNKTPKKIENL